MTSNTVAALLEERLQRLKEKYPQLKSVVIRPIRETNLTETDLSLFIEAAWQAYYGDRPRLRFTPQLVKWFMDVDSPASIAAFQNEKLSGCFLCAERPFSRQGQENLRSVLATGWSVSLSATNRGLGNLAYLEMLARARAEGIPYVLCWFDVREGLPATSHKIARRTASLLESRISILGKPVDFRAASRIQPLKWWEHAAARAFFGLHSPRRRTAIRGSVSVKASRVLPLYDICTRNRRLRRSFDEASLAGQLEGPGADNILYFQESDGEVTALLQGFRNEAGPGASVAYIDLLLLHPRLSYRQKRAFLLTAEKEIQETNRCFAIVVSTTATSENLLKYGYLPIETQVLGATTLSDVPLLSPGDLAGAFLDLK